MTHRTQDADEPGQGQVDAAKELFAGARPTKVVRALPELAKVSASAWWRTSRWGVSTSLRFGDIVLTGATSGQPADAILRQISAEARETVREALGITDLADPMPKTMRERAKGNGAGEPGDLTIPDRLAALLAASADVDYSGVGHPAYVRLLSELDPDEARILRLFAEKGPQAAVDVRTKRPFGVGSRLVAPGLTMIARYAGCRDADRVPAYLNNLFRLGLIWFSREALADQSAYDVLEAQDEVQDAMAEAGGGTTVRRSIELTAFGRNLVAMGGLLPETETVSRASEEEAESQLPPPDAR
ncbi:MAG TPA: Abi-alpha family protein [Nocardioidaceae bacterium]|nr:Abi-alpha family protein [Nocardioidaceae bacterium]